MHHHILNGDALAAQFPPSLPGERIIMRECLVDGPVHSSHLEEFFKQRAQFIAQIHPETSEQAYYQGSVGEFEKIQSLPKSAKVHLWFEDDLFCQVNFWFVAHLLHQHTAVEEVYLVRPEVHTQYGFGGLSKDELLEAFTNKILLEDLTSFAQLWAAYQQGDWASLLATAKALQASYPFVGPAVQAQLNRIPEGDFPGRPIQSLKTIIAELNTDKFGPIFQEFCKRESIYGFGDLQVKRLLEEHLNTLND